jgi:hypothetical protein
MDAAMTEAERIADLEDKLKAAERTIKGNLAPR